MRNTDERPFNPISCSAITPEHHFRLSVAEMWRREQAGSFQANTAQSVYAGAAGQSFNGQQRPGQPILSISIRLNCWLFTHTHSHYHLLLLLAHAQSHCTQSAKHSHPKKHFARFHYTWQMSALVVHRLVLLILRCAFVRVRLKPWTWQHNNHTYKSSRTPQTEPNQFWYY